MAFLLYHYAPAVKTCQKRVSEQIYTSFDSQSDSWLQSDRPACFYLWKHIWEIRIQSENAKSVACFAASNILISGFCRLRSELFLWQDILCLLKDLKTLELTFHMLIHLTIVQPKSFLSHFTLSAPFSPHFLSHSLTISIKFFIRPEPSGWFWKQNIDKEQFFTFLLLRI